MIQFSKWYYLRSCSIPNPTVFCNVSNRKPPQAKLRCAAKARLIRWVKPKSKRLDRVAPEIVQQEWAKGNKASLADLFCRVNFNEDRFYLFTEFCAKNAFTVITWGFTYQHPNSSTLRLSVGELYQPVEDNRVPKTDGRIDHRRGMVFRKRTQARSQVVYVLFLVSEYRSCNCISICVKRYQIPLKFSALPLDPVAFPGQRSMAPRSGAGPSERVTAGLEGLTCKAEKLDQDTTVQNQSHQSSIYIKAIDLAVKDFWVNTSFCCIWFKMRPNEIQMFWVLVVPTIHTILDS